MPVTLAFRADEALALPRHDIYARCIVTMLPAPRTRTARRAQQTLRRLQLWAECVEQKNAMSNLITC